VGIIQALKRFFSVPGRPEKRFWRKGHEREWFSPNHEKIIKGMTGIRNRLLGGRGVEKNFFKGFPMKLN
jgi:hypothetical protein